MLSFSECTQAGIFKLSSSRTLPFWWDDVSDFSTLEALTVQTFNQVNKLLEHQQHEFLLVTVAVAFQFLLHMMEFIHKECLLPLSWEIGTWSALF